MKRSMLIATMQCVGCSHQWTVREGEIVKDDHPMCPACMMPGVLLKAERRIVDDRQAGILLIEFILIVACIAAGVIPVVDQVVRDQRVVEDSEVWADALRQSVPAEVRQ